jgi:hypothetical protein
MVWKLMMALVVVIGLLFAARSTVAGPAQTGLAPTSGAAMRQSARLGPFATARRANEVANYWRNQGFNAGVVREYAVEYDTMAYFVYVW